MNYNKEAKCLTFRRVAEVSQGYRAVVAMTVLTLHLALGEPERQISFPEASKNCALKLVRKFVRQFPLIVLSVWWDRTGSRYAFHARPLSYVDTTLSKLEGSTLIWTNEVMDGLECKSSFWSCASRFFHHQLASEGRYRKDSGLLWAS